MTQPSYSTHSGRFKLASKTTFLWRIWPGFRHNALSSSRCSVSPEQNARARAHDLLTPSELWVMVKENGWPVQETVPHHTSRVTLTDSAAYKTTEPASPFNRVHHGPQKHFCDRSALFRVVTQGNCHILVGQKTTKGQSSRSTRERPCINVNKYPCLNTQS